MNLKYILKKGKLLDQVQYYNRVLNLKVIILLSYYHMKINHLIPKTILSEIGFLIKLCYK